MKNAIGLLMVSVMIGIMVLIGKFFLDREPLKERQQYVIIKSVGVYHKYIVDGKNVIVEYEEAE
jgi:hypothetical protein